LIDPRAVVHTSARIAADVSVGPYSIIGADVEIGAGTWIGPHVVIDGPTRLGRDNRIFQFASIGADPQDKKYTGEATLLEIGDRNTLREFCTLNRGTAQDQGATRIGNDNWIMAYVHVAHDCQLGNHLILSNCTTLGGHVVIDDYANLGGFTKVAQFCRIGANSFCGLTAGITRDVPPFIITVGTPARPNGINAEGLRRRGFGSEKMKAIRRAYKLLYRSGLRFESAIEEIKLLAEEHAELLTLVEFLTCSERSIVR
jgi:UDP-N-acetylglucosamine acyltransferase